ncbi:MAG: SMP-30/gluconolactonase/LRE family protein [Myxococcales bacterium]|nr:SMP-30/gluconolactonase/LRE family protein [Myxococcales bacterium]
MSFQERFLVKSSPLKSSENWSFWRMSKLVFLLLGWTALLFLSACPAEKGPCQKDSECAGGSEVCLAGACVCKTGDTRCGLDCVDITKNGSHCGGCGKACAAGQSCEGGACKVAASCNAPRSKCGADCVDLNEDVRHCGACSQPCAEGQLCKQGVCELACSPRQSRCGQECIDLQANGAHCGACGQACSQGQVCSKGTCVAACPEATPTVCLGGCVDEQHNPQHCGACGQACASGQACVKGKCECSQGLTDCNGKCVDLKTNQQSCGACGKVCENGQFCSSTGCVASCPAATPEICFGGCVNFQTDSLHCGGCGKACAPDERCEAGTCVCGSGRLRCSGACVDSQTDLRHCGQCDFVCPRNQSCSEGLCTDKCPAETLRCGEFCVDLKNNDKHCGGCDKACAPTEYCKDSTCVPSNCPIGQRRCGGACVDLLRDEAHCGQCQQACIQNQVCISGQCQERPVVETLAGQPPWRDGEASFARYLGPCAIAVDAQGNVYIADRENHRIRKLDTKGNVTTIAGTGKEGYANGPASKADLDSPSGIAVDGQGRIFFAERGNHLIRMIDGMGRVVDFAGTGKSGFADGPANQAQFDTPYGIAFGKDGSLYVADRENHRIRKIDTSGNVTTVAGTGKSGLVNGVGAQARFAKPHGIAVDDQGNVYVADYGNAVVRKITAAGEVSTLAGDGTQGSKDGPALMAQFDRPRGIALDAKGNLYVADEGSHQIRKIDTNGDVTTYAGSGSAGAQDGDAKTGTFNVPVDLVFLSNGDLLIADLDNNRIRKVDTALQLSTLSGGPNKGFANGPINEALFNSPSGLFFSKTGDLYVTDEDNHAIRKITPAGEVSTIAGFGSAGFLDGPGNQALFDSPYGIVANSKGELFVTDRDNHRIRKIDASGNVTTFAGQDTAGLVDGMGTTAQFNEPYGIAIDAQDNLYIADSGNHVIRKIDATGKVTTYAGSGDRGFQDGPIATARFDSPHGMAFDAQGNLYIADRGNHRIRKIDTQGVLSTIAGTGSSGYSDGPGLQAEFDRPASLVLDAQGNLFVVDQNNERIRQIDTTGKVSTLAGTGVAGFQDGALGQAQFSDPFGIAIDAQGNLYVGDRINHCIRRILR